MVNRFDALEPGDRLLVWSCRYAHACRGAGRDPLPMLLDLHRRNGSESTAIALLHLVAGQGTGGCEIRSPACPFLSRDECDLLRKVRGRENLGDIAHR